MSIPSDNSVLTLTKKGYSKLKIIHLFSCVYNFCINTLQSYQRSPNMSSVRERQRLLMQRNYKDATYLEQQNYRRRLQYQRLQQVQHELTGMFFEIRAA
jgi:hypothetical protein